MKLTGPEKKLLEWRDNPKAFVMEALRAEPIAWQVEALEAIRDNNRIAIKSGHPVFTAAS